MVCPHHGILFGNEKGRIIDTYSDFTETLRNYTELEKKKKASPGRLHTYDPIYVTFLK